MEKHKKILTFVAETSGNDDNIRWLFKSYSRRLIDTPPIAINGITVKNIDEGDVIEKAQLLEQENISLKAQLRDLQFRLDSLDK